jgi:hypothetical protein
MQSNQTPRSYSTTRAGLVLGIQAASLSTAKYRNGHYCNVVPARLPNGRLLWPADQIDALAAGARADEAPDTGARLAAARNQAAAAGRIGGAE